MAYTNLLTEVPEELLTEDSEELIVEAADQSERYYILSKVIEVLETITIKNGYLTDVNHVSENLDIEHPEQLAELIADLQAFASKAGAPAPLFISVDQEGGRVSRLNPPFTRFPEPCCLGLAQSESLAQRFGLALGHELNAVGINMDYAPVLDVNTNPDNPIIGKRAFSNDPDWAGRLGVSFMKGMQEAGVLPVGKHFPGHGDTSLDSHLALPTVDRANKILEQVELVPFQQAIQHGLDVIMTAHVIYHAWDDKNTATFSPMILQTILRERLGFKGLVMSDDGGLDDVVEVFDKNFQGEQCVPAV